ncbi:MAG TPA: hypothetical protein VIL88_17770 [Devosia sp.]|jgi:predicted TIM-barrel fold metal-dependent hydrolase|uniref:hypothetical protein n=1 Tax=Devosia sp. TaxID=1871048 RepID=UPI002F929095
MTEFPKVHHYANGRCRNCGEYRPEGLTDRKICAKCAEHPDDVLAAMAALEMVDYHGSEWAAESLLEGFRKVGFQLVPVDQDAGAADRVDPVRLLWDACAAAGSQAAWAKAHSFSAPFVGDVLAGNRAPSDRLLTALGCRRVFYFVKGAAA